MLRKRLSVNVINRVVSKNFSNNDGTSVTIQSLFTKEWASATTEKIVSARYCVILGSSNPARAALSIGSQSAGKLTLNISGQIQGAGGRPGVNGGRGGDALTIKATSTSGQDLIIMGFQQNSRWRRRWRGRRQERQWHRHEYSQGTC